MRDKRPAVSVLLECERLLEFRGKEGQMQRFLSYSFFRSILLLLKKHGDCILRTLSLAIHQYFPFFTAIKSILRRCMTSFFTVTTELETSWRSKMALGPTCPHALPKLGAHGALSARLWGALCPGWKNLGGFLTCSEVLLTTG